MRPAPLRLLALIAVSAGLLVGCTGGSSGDDAPEAPAGSTTTSTAPTPDGPEVTATGAAPRTALRLRLTEGTSTTIRHTTDLVVVQATGTTTEQVDPPPITQTIAFTVGEVDATGAEVSFLVTDVVVEADGTTTPPAEALLLQADLAGLTGITGTGHLSDRGHLDRIAFQLPAGTSESVRRQVEDLEGTLGSVVPTLPEEPVGVGATWEASGTSEVGGVETDQVTTYELTGIDGDALSFSSTTAFATEPQDVAGEGLPAGTTARLESSDLTGEATGTMDLASPAHTLTSTATGTQVLTVAGADGTPVTVSQRITLATEVAAVG